jgi:hypothetical protein
MRCQDFRAAVGAEPSTQCDDIAAHARECEVCATFRRDLQALDRVIFAALQTEPATIERMPATRAAPARARAWSAAAGILIAVGLAAGIWLAGTRSSFAEQVVAHAQGEPRSLLHTLEVASDADVTNVLSRAGLRFRSGSLRISYAQGCWFHGHFAPHLVVQTDDGPVTVLVLPDEPTPTRATRFQEAGFEGVVIPAQRGVLVLLAKGAHVDTLAGAIRSALS